MTRARQLARSALCAAGHLVGAPLRAQQRAALQHGVGIRNILVLNDVAGLGNLVLLSGLLLNLRRVYPRAHIVVAMPSAALASSVLTPALADAVLFYDGSDQRRLLNFARRVLRPQRFDLGLATFFAPTITAAAMLAVAGCRFRVAYAADERAGFLNTITLRDTGGHELDRHLRLLQFTGTPLQRRTKLYVGAAAAADAAEYLAGHGLAAKRPLLGVHPGCDRVNAVKRWPSDRFAAVIDRMARDLSAGAIVFLGREDAELHAPLARLLGEQACIVHEQPFTRVAALIARCNAFLTNDSGLMHVAAAVSVPVAAIFGPTGTEKNAPVGSATTLVTARGVPCRPCYVGPPLTCMHPTRYCLESIGVDQVVQAVQALLAPAARSLVYADERVPAMVARRSA